MINEIPKGLKIDWSRIKPPNFVYDPRTPDQLVDDWIAGIIKSDPTLLISDRDEDLSQKSTSIPYPGEPGK